MIKLDSLLYLILSMTVDLYLCTATVIVKPVLC